LRGRCEVMREASALEVLVHEPHGDVLKACPLVLSSNDVVVVNGNRPLSLFLSFLVNEKPDWREGESFSKKQRTRMKNQKTSTPFPVSNDVLLDNAPLNFIRLGGKQQVVDEFLLRH